MMGDFTYIDLFAGAGGTTTGAMKAFETHGIKPRVVAINHLHIAVQSHKWNHPEAEHHCSGVGTVEPLDIAKPDDKITLWASPDCTFHSKALGGKPVNDQRREPAWFVVNKWMKQLKPGRVYVENVPEFVNWGPLNEKNKPIKSRSGEIFAEFIKAMTDLGYAVEWQVLNASDYGAPTERRRLIIQACLPGHEIVWPEKSTEPAPTAMDIIDWDDPGTSMFSRKKPLVAATQRRIKRGIEKYWGDWAPYFIQAIEQGAPLVMPMAEVPASLKPFMTIHRGTGNTRDIERPAPSITAGGLHEGLVQPLIDKYYGTGRAMPASERLHTQTAKDRFAVVIPYFGQSEAMTPDKPLGSLTTRDSFAVMRPFIGAYYGDNGKRTPRTASTDKPLPTVTTGNRFSTVQGFITFSNGGAGQRTRSVERGLPTITTKDNKGIVRGHIGLHYSPGYNKPFDEPLATITKQDHHSFTSGVVSEDEEYLVLDIYFRMLKPDELKQAQGFPKDYVILGTKEQQTKQIGNAVPVQLGEALITAALEATKPEKVAI